MSDMPAIVISELDIDRLEGLLDKKPYRDDPVFNTLKAELARATVVKPEQVPDDVVRMNSVVTFEVEESGQQFQMKLCFPHEMKDAQQAISVFAPIGGALIGLSVGQKIDWTLPDTKHRHVKIIRVENPA